MGIVECDTMLMLLAASTEMEQELRLTATKQMMNGFIGQCFVIEEDR
jgi:selenide,water dikinase